MNLSPITAIAAALRAGVVAAVTDDLAAAAAGTPELTAPSAPAPASPAPLSPGTPAIDMARAAAAGRQGGLAPLLADLAQALATPAVPAAVKAAIGQVLALQTPTDEPITAQTIAQAVSQSGLFLEARLAGLEGEPPPDLKAALLKLQAALAAGGTQGRAPAARTPPPAPPARNGGLSAQPAAPSGLPTDADAATITEVLARGADQALARQTLHQLASLPDGPATAWMFEAPFATPQGATVAQFAIERDGRGAERANREAVWRVRLSIDIEPLGPIHVHLTAGGERSAVTVWAERPDSLRRLRREAADLAAALSADVRFQAGAPRQPAPSAGSFVDESS